MKDLPTPTEGIQNPKGYRHPRKMSVVQRYLDPKGKKRIHKLQEPNGKKWVAIPDPDGVCELF
jgi:hypothetical protein